MCCWLFSRFYLPFIMFADLRDGELIHGDNFNLFAAMSALEVLIMSLIILNLFILFLAVKYELCVFLFNLGCIK